MSPLSRYSRFLFLFCSLGLATSAFAHEDELHQPADNLEEYLAQMDTLLMCRTHGQAGKYEQERTVKVNPKSIRTVKEILHHGGYLGPCADFGDRQSMGNGYFETYVQLKKDKTPWAIGYVFGESTLVNMPTKKNDGQNCFDVNGNGKLEEDGTSVLNDTDLHHDECVAGHQRVLFFPHQDKIKPFKWALLNYQPQGHSPVMVYGKPHFDFHFMTMDFIERNYIRVGPCGLLINCEDFVKAVKPIAPQFIPADFITVGAAEARMGDHRVDVTSGEWHGHDYTHTWIYGAYDGSIIFWEPMITVEYLKSKPYTCVPIKLPEAYQESGYYPTSYCMRYSPERKEYRVSIEGLVYRDKSL